MLKQILRFFTKKLCISFPQFETIIGHLSTYPVKTASIKKLSNYSMDLLLTYIIKSNAEVQIKLPGICVSPIFAINQF